MSVATEITRIQNAKADIKTAIENKGVTVGDGTIDTYAAKIDDIPSGGPVDQDSALQYMLNNKTNYTGIAAGLTTLTELPTFTQPSGLTNFYGAFDGCSGLTDASGLDFSTVGASKTDFTNMFRGCASLVTLPTNMNFTTTLRTHIATSMFEGCSSLASFPQLPYLNFTDVSRMFYGCSGLTGAISVGASTNWPNWTTAESMFRGCSNVTSISIVATGVPQNITSWASCFSGCSNLQTISLPNNSATKTTTVTGLFAGCNNLGNLTSMQIRYFTGGGVPSAATMFRYCESMTSIPLTAADFANCTSYSNTFQGCSSLTSSPLTSSMTSQVTQFQTCFALCTDLTTVAALDLSSCTSNSALQNMFYSCPNLTNTSLNNILSSLATYAGTANKTLKYVGLSSTQATTCTGLSNWAALEAAGWTTGY